ncbi:MAG: alcohol dehydrogenase catalytic domain-containing protein [Acidobacteria bacterium]|nr:alcohol dehydrogenase catalytic domain-containing protein [Acidobacteriota bacterium]
MRAIVLDYEHRSLLKRDVPVPAPLGDGEVLFRIEEVGVCGTDRELASFRFGYPPAGRSFLVLGHEAVGTVLETGRGVRSLQPGDLVVPMIRRGCRPPCSCCARSRADLCTTGNYRERGIFGVDGYFIEMAVDSEEDLVRVPPALAAIAVLAEPLSVVEKAMASAFRYRQEPPSTALVLGAGPIGLLATLALLGRGLTVLVHSLEPADHPRARLVEQAGARYVPELGGVRADLVLEATGSPQAAFAAIGCLGPLGVCGLLGAAVGTGQVSFRDLVVGNRVVFGSVNASPESFQSAVEQLARFDRTVVDKLIHRAPFEHFAASIAGPPSETAKVVHVIH